VFIPLFGLARIIAEAGVRIKPKRKSRDYTRGILLPYNSRPVPPAEQVAF